MCGRFVAASPPDQIARYFHAEPPDSRAGDSGRGEARDEELLEPRYNVAPTQDVYAVVEHGGAHKVEPFLWGLVPHWAKDLKVGTKMINARADSLAERNAFKSSFEKRRCIVAADGFYEWKPIEGTKKKQPYYLSRADGELLAFAGLWATWRNPSQPDEWVHSCTIITGEPNAAVSEIHDRMPVILPPATWDRWLDRDEHDLDLLSTLLVPAPDSLLTIHPVSTLVSNVRNDGPELIEKALPLDEHGEPLQPQASFDFSPC